MKEYKSVDITFIILALLVFIPLGILCFVVKEDLLYSILLILGIDLYCLLCHVRFNRKMNKEYKNTDKTSETEYE